MKLTFLGTGTSFGIPVIGCRCETCTSSDPRDHRTRHAALIHAHPIAPSPTDQRNAPGKAAVHSAGDSASGSARRSDVDAAIGSGLGSDVGAEMGAEVGADVGAAAVLIDCPPELRLQLTRANVSAVDAVWITHCHADHIHGMDDLRAVTARRGQRLDIYASAECSRTLEERFGYIFSEYRPPRGTTKPELHLRTFQPFESVEIPPFSMRALPVRHGPLTAYGFRIGMLGYITDAKSLSPGTREALEGVRTLVLNALWFGNPHPTHLNVEEALHLAEEIGAEHTYLTHLTHRLSHHRLEQDLPDWATPAYDGLTIDV